MKNIRHENINKYHSAEADDKMMKAERMMRSMDLAIVNMIEQGIRFNDNLSHLVYNVYKMAENMEKQAYHIWRRDFISSNVNKKSLMLIGGMFAKRLPDYDLLKKLYSDFIIINGSCRVEDYNNGCHCKDCIKIRPCN